MTSGTAIAPRPAPWAANPRNFWTTRSVLIIYAACMVVQASGYWFLGTGAAGMGLSELLIVLQHVVAIACAWTAFRRTQGMPALFWLLFGIAMVVLLVPNMILAGSTLLAHNLLSDRTWRALYTLYGAPILMMLILPDSDRSGQVRWGILLDLFQVALVVALVFSTLFYLPLQEMLPADALTHNLTISNLVSLFLLSAVIVRLRFARAPGVRDRILRLGTFLLCCAVVTFIGNWIDEHHYSVVSAWWDLGWDVPIAAGALVAISWRNPSEPEADVEHPGFLLIAARNLTVVVILTFLHFIMDASRITRGNLFTNLAVTLSLLAFTFRSALTQHHQQQEITQRQQAQNQLTAANGKIGILLTDARRQTAEITQINELGSLLQACSSGPEAYRLIAERLLRLFPGASGSLALMNASRNRVEAVAEWGAHPPADQTFTPDECWALRRGCVHALGEGISVLRCQHLRGADSSVCIPLIASGKAIGTLAIQGKAVSGTNTDDLVTEEAESFLHRRDLVVAVAEHIALALADLQLREALRTQAIRDPLTGLYNRRYMQEFFERETQRARRKNRPLAVLALDLDHFKSFNDTHGHAAGDHALSLVGDVLLHSVRADDVACRYGGEEFIVILPECTLAQAIRRAEQIRLRLHQRPLEFQGSTPKTITVSIGVAAFDETTDRIERLLACADEALYQAKREGRDRVVPARPVVAGEELLSDSHAAAKT